LIFKKNICKRKAVNPTLLVKFRWLSHMINPYAQAQRKGIDVIPDL